MTVLAAERAIIGDDGREIQLTLYLGRDAVAVMTPSPQRALALAGELLAAASRRFDAGFGSHCTPPPRRGGDRQAGKRAQRDAALRALAGLMGDDTSVEQQARVIADRLARYRPMPVDTSPERLLMHEVLDSGLGVPGAERIRKILRSGPSLT